MLHRGIKFVHVAIILFAAMLSFLFVRGLDEELVLGSSAQVWVTRSDDSVSGGQVAREIAEFADQHEVAVARVLPDLKNPDSLRHLYLASGDAASDAASWLTDGYPAFGSHVDTAVHPMAEIGQRDPRGFYYVFGSPHAADDLVARLADIGLSATVQHPLASGKLAGGFVEGELFWSFCVVALAAVTMTGASVLLGARTYGVLRLQGMSWVELLLRDLKQLAVFWAVVASAVVVAVLTSLGLYNGFAHFTLFASVAACLVCLLVLLVVATHAAALALTFKVDVLRALKGELPARPAFAATYLVRVPAVLLALGFAMDLVSAGQHVTVRQDNQDVYAKADEAVTIRLNGSWGGDSGHVVTQVGQWLRKADAADEIVVAGRQDLQNLPSNGHFPHGEMLIVNETFLAEQTVVDPKGRPYSPLPHVGKSSNAHTVRLIVPETLARHAEALKSAVPDVFGKLDPDLRKRLTVESLPAKSGQRVFGYNSGNRSPNTAYSPDDDRTLVRDAVLVVVPNGSQILTDDAYTTFATQDGIIFPDPHDILGPLEANEHNLQTYVATVNPVGQIAAESLRSAVNEFRLLFFNFLASVAVLLITGLGVCVIYSRKNAQATFALHLNGWRFTATHRFILGVEGLLAAFLAWWVPIQTWQQNKDLEELAAQGIPAPFPAVHLTGLDLGVIAGLVVIEFGAVILALGAFHRRTVKERAAEA